MRREAPPSQHRRDGNENDQGNGNDQGEGKGKGKGERKSTAARPVDSRQKEILE